MTDTDWPYDAEQGDPLTAFRIPVVPHARHHWHYMMAFCQDRIDNDGHRPDGPETAMLLSFLDYLKQDLTGWWTNKMMERPFDIDGGFNGITFRKYGPGDWGYRRRTWTQPSDFAPGYPSTRRDGLNAGQSALTLEQVMDRIYSIDGEIFKHWAEWKAANPQVFTGA